MILRAGGNVGIGTSSPGYLLDVGGSFRSQGLAILASQWAAQSSPTVNNQGAWIGWNASAGGGETNFINQIGSGGGPHFTWASSTTSNVRTEYMRLDTSGRLGIGTTSPGYPLDVTGSMRSTGVGYFGYDGTNGYTVLQQGNTTNTGYVAFYSGAGVRNGYIGYGGGASGTINFWADLSSAMVFGTNNTERMRIAGGGQVGIGTSAPGYLLTVAGTSSLNGVLIDGDIHTASNSSAYTVSGGSVYNNGGAIAFYGSGGSVPGALIFNSDAGAGSVERLRIAGNGEIYMNQAQSPTQTYDVGYLGLPINTQGSNYTAVLSDAGKTIAIVSGTTVTIPTNASVAYPVGTTLTILNTSGSGNVSISCADTFYLANTSGTSGTRTLAPLGVATAIKYVSNAWIISGNGLT
jgi:hypothetical protein